MISKIADGAFYGLSQLKQLLLPGGALTEVGRNTFAGLLSLEILNIAQHGITTIAEEAFTGLGNMVELQGKWNKLSTITRGSLKGLSSLEYLNLNHNWLRSLGSNIFVNTPKLKVLRLT